MTAPAGHVTVAAVPKLLPVPHAVVSSDDVCERDGVADLDTDLLRDSDGDAPKDWLREDVGEIDGEPTREREAEGERERDTVGVSPAWHCT